MRITFILPPPNMTGGMRVVSIYAQKLKERGHEVVLVYLPQPRMSLREWLRMLCRERRLSLRRVNSGSHLDDLDVEHRVLEARRPIESGDLPDADVVIAVWYPAIRAVFGLPRSKGVPIALLQGYELNGTAQDLLIREGWSSPLKKIVVSQWLADIAKNEFGDANATVVPNAVDHEVFRAPERTKQLRPTVGFVHRAGVVKRTPMIFEACATVLKEIPELKVVAFGSETEHRSLPTPKFVQYTTRPAQDSLRDLYGQCDAWIVASMSEGFGLPILEAMACRTPVISTRVGIAPTALGNGAGILLSRPDPEELAEAIRRICRMSSDEWRELSDKAYAVAQTYSWDDSVSRLERALVEIVHSG